MMKRTLVAAGLCLLIATSWILLPESQVGAQQEKVKVESKHYVVYSWVGEEKGRELGENMDRVFDVYTELLSVDEPPEKKLVIRLYRDEAQFESSPGGRKGIAGLYNQKNKELIGFWENAPIYTPYLTFSNFAHEGMHQFTDAAVGSMEDLVAKGSLPMWFVEGFADCAGNSEIRLDKKGNKQFWMCLVPGPIANHRIRNLKIAIQRKLLWTWEDLFFKVGYQEFKRKALIGYIEGWSVCHFLLCYPRVEDWENPVPNGKYKSILLDLWKGFADKKSKEEVYAFVFGKGDKGLKKIKELEKEWMTYIKNFPDVPEAAGWNGLTARERKDLNEKRAESEKDGSGAKKEKKKKKKMHRRKTNRKKK